MKLFLFNKGREFPDIRGIISCYMDSEFSKKLPDVAAEWLTPLVFISELTGSSLDEETDCQLRLFLHFHPT